MDRLNALQRNSEDGGSRRPRSSSNHSPRRNDRENSENITSPVRPRATSPLPSNDYLRPDFAGGRRRTMGSPSPAPSSALRRRGTAASSQRGNSMTRQATGVSYAPSAGNFTLAGPQNPVAVAHQHQPYVHPGYSHLNPAYEQPATARPVWSLAKPMPRVVRPGMVPSASELNVSQPSETPITEQDVEKGPDPTLRLDRVSSKLKNVNAERERRFLEAHGVGVPARQVSRQISTTSSRRSRRPSNFPPAGMDPQDVLPGVEEEEEMQHGDLGDAGLNPDARNHPELDDNLSEKTVLDPGPEADEPELEPLQGYNGLEDEVHNVHTRWSVVRLRFREALAEFLAVIIQLTLGFCANLSYLVGNQTDAVYIDFAWGFSTMIAIYIAGGISGAHLNPVVTIVLYVYRGFPKRKIPEYIIAQLLGAFIAGFIAYGLYRSQIIEYLATNNDDPTQTVANYFVTNLRNARVNVATGFFNEFVGTAFLVIIILALGDDSNAPPGAGMSALILGFIIFVLIQAFGYSTGAALNPTRDLGPRFALLCLGFGGERLFGDGWFAYGPIAACISGGLVGAAIYDICIFTGGESPVNYPRERVWRAGHKAKKRWARRLHISKGGDTDGFNEIDEGPRA